MSHITRRDFVGQTAAVAGAGVLASVATRLGSAIEAAPAVATRPFGRTGVPVTLIGVGGGSRFFGNVPDDEVGAETLRYAIDRGMCFLETASAYGPSERRIGLAMPTHRDRVFLETKIDKRDYDGAMRSMEESLKRLRTDHIDLMLHHYLGSRAELDTILAAGGAEAAIRKMVDQKVIRFRGFSTHIPVVALEAITRLEPDAIQLPLNATRLPDFEAEVLEAARKRGVAVIAMKTCGHGYFRADNFTRPDRVDRYGAPADVLARTDLPTYKEYLHYALSLPIATAVVGIDSPKTVDGVVENAMSFKPMSPDALKALAARAQVFNKTGYWVNETE